MHPAPAARPDGTSPLRTVARPPEQLVGERGERARDKVYENVIREGTSELQEALLSAGLLRRVWPQLRLPKRCRDSWEARFPELAAA